MNDTIPQNSPHKQGPYENYGKVKDQIEVMLREGYSGIYIAKTLHCHPGTVAWYAKRLNLRNSDRRKPMLQEHVKTISQVSEEWGISRSVITDAIHREIFPANRSWEIWLIDTSDPNFQRWTTSTRHIDKDVQRRFWSRTLKTDTCWLWQGSKTKFGYGCLSHHNKQYNTHRLAYEWFVGPIPEGLLVCHKCDVPACVNPDHLFLGIVKDNAMDRQLKGRGRVGSHNQLGDNNNNAKLNEEIVREIRRLYSQGISQADIMRATGITRANVWAVIHRISWKHIE